MVSGFQNLNIVQRGFFGIIQLENGDIKVITLKQYIDVLNHDIESEQKGFLVFADPSDLLQNPGWPLRNLLYLVLLHW